MLLWTWKKHQQTLMTIPGCRFKPSIALNSAALRSITNSVEFGYGAAPITVRRNSS